jgi:SRSO17 transposase
MGLPPGLVFRTKGQLAIDILTEAFADGVQLDFVCGDEVYGSCTQLRLFLEARGQAYVLRVPSNLHLTLARGVRLSASKRLPGYGSPSCAPCHRRTGSQHLAEAVSGD